MAGGFHGYDKVSANGPPFGVTVRLAFIGTCRYPPYSNDDLGAEIDLAMSEPNHTAGNPGSDESSNDCTVRERDRFMPIANVIRIISKILPPRAKISDDAKETIQECVSEYISFIAGEANERCQREQRKTITAEDVLWAMGKLGFDDYFEPLTVYFHRYRELEGDRGSLRCVPMMKRTSQAANYPSLGVPGFHQVYQHGYHRASAAYNVARGYFRDGINHNGTSHAPSTNGEAHRSWFE